MKLDRLKNLADPTFKKRPRMPPSAPSERHRDKVRSEVRGAWWASVGGQISLIVLLLISWPIPIINPLKLIVVLIHEFSHVVTAWATGGVVFGIAIHPGGAGATLGMGGNELLIVLSGYVGSFLVGVLLYLALMKLEPDEIWALLGILCGLSLIFQWLNSFTAFFGYGALILIALGTFWDNPNIKELIIRLIASASCLYPVFDVGGELFSSSRTGFTYEGRTAMSDLALLSMHTGISEWILGAVFISVGLFTVISLIGCTAGHYARDRQRLITSTRRSSEGSSDMDSDRRYYIS